MGIQKIDFEMTVLAMNAPKRVEKILSGIEETGNMEYIVLSISQYFQQKMKEGKLHPRIPIEKLISYISASYSGIQMSCIVQACYRQMPMGAWYEPGIQLETLAKTTNYLLGEDA